jgi:hypothetical protein
VSAREKGMQVGVLLLAADPGLGYYVLSLGYMLAAAGQGYEARLAKTLLGQVDKRRVEAWALEYLPSASCVIKVGRCGVGW